MAGISAGGGHGGAVGGFVTAHAVQVGASDAHLAGAETQMRENRRLELGAEFDGIGDSSVADGDEGLDLGESGTGLPVPAELLNLRQKLATGTASKSASSAR